MAEKPSSDKRVVSKLTDEQLAACMAIAEGAAAKEDKRGCRLVNTAQNKKLSRNQKQYVQIKVPKHPNPNTKVQLHQLVCWLHPNTTSQAKLRTAICEAKLEISHICKEKACMNPDHFVAEPSEVNKSRNYCPAVVRINNSLHPCCRHTPRCIPSDEDERDALEYHV